MAWLLASWSRFRFRVLHKATSGPWVAAADDDDYDDERLNCQQANSLALFLSYSAPSTVMAQAPGREKSQDRFPVLAKH
jgi:hypothetical protein